MNRMIPVLMMLALSLTSAAGQSPPACADLSLSAAGTLSTGGALTLSLQNAPAGSIAVFETSLTDVTFGNGSNVGLPLNLAPACFALADGVGAASCVLPIPQIPASLGVASVTLAARATIYDLSGLTPPITVTICFSDLETLTVTF